MNNDIKTAKYYSHAKMYRALMLMEQCWILAQNPEISEEDKKCALALFNHYRRLAMCILMKDMPEQIIEEQIIDVEYMKNIYKKYSMPVD